MISVQCLLASKVHVIFFEIYQDRDSELRLVKSQRGRQSFHHNGFQFYMKRVNTNRATMWWCVKSPSCPDSIK